MTTNQPAPDDGSPTQQHTTSPRRRFIGIHSVEARHASVHNELNVSSPFPAGVDEAMSMSEVKETAGQFIVS